jgi:surface antigen
VSTIAGPLTKKIGLVEWLLSNKIRYIMALILDSEPPLERGSKQTKSQKDFTKIKNYLGNTAGKLASAIFLLAKFAGKVLRGVKIIYAQIKEQIPVAMKQAPHLTVFLIASVVIISNIAIKSAKADYALMVPSEPSSKIAIAQIADTYTPVISDDSLAVERAYVASDNGFEINTASAVTTMTEREEPLPDNSNSTVRYTVRNGDTLTTLGWKFNVKLATLKYLNDLENIDVIKPGQQLKVPPAGYEVSASQIAAKENEKKKKLLASASKSVKSSSSSAKKISHPVGSKYNGYPYGYCTYYVATRRAVPTSMGNAKYWLSSANRNGMSTGSSPVEGAIVVTNESWAGHVAYVEEVGNGYIVISEMNYRGWGVISRRSIPSSGGVVRGYVY